MHFQLPQYRVADIHGRFPEASADPVHERLYQKRDVFPALAQGRQVQRRYAQPVEKVLPEVPVRRHLTEIAICGGDDPNIDFAWAVFTDDVHLIFLHHSQNLFLELRLEIADFVEENGSSVGGFEFAALAGGGAGESSLAVSEEFRFSNVSGMVPQLITTNGFPLRGLL
jgi:hypothetical protein